MAAEDKRTAGQPFRPPPATMWNAMVEAGEQVQAGRFNQPGGSSRARKTDIIEVKNLSGAARARGEVLGAFTNPFTNIERDNIKLSGAAPTAGGHVGVVLDPVANDKYGRVQLAGVCVATVNISDEDHEFAEIDPGEHKLVSAASGAIAIIYAPAGTGDKDCVVRLGGGGGGGFSVADTTSSITAGGASTVGSGTVQKKKRDATGLVNDGAAITVYNSFGVTVASGARIYIARDAHGDWWIPSEDCGV